MFRVLLYFDTQLVACVTLRVHIWSVSQFHCAFLSPKHDCSSYAFRAEVRSHTVVCSARKAHVSEWTILCCACFIFRVGRFVRCVCGCVGGSVSCACGVAVCLVFSSSALASALAAAAAGLARGLGPADSAMFH